MALHISQLLFIRLDEPILTMSRGLNYRFLTNHKQFYFMNIPWKSTRIYCMETLIENCLGLKKCEITNLSGVVSRCLRLRAPDWKIKEQNNPQKINTRQKSKQTKSHRTKTKQYNAIHLFVIQYGIIIWNYISGMYNLSGLSLLILRHNSW